MTHSEKKYRLRRKLKARNKHSHKRVYLHVSNKHLNAQLVNDQTGATLLSLTTASKANVKKNCANVAHAKTLAGTFVQKMTEKKYSMDEKFVFDRGDKVYHGKVAAFVDELREKGIKI